MVIWAQLEHLKGAHGCCAHFLTLSQQLCARRLLKDYDSGPQAGEGHVQAAAAGEGSQLRGEVPEVGSRGAPQKLEHVVVQPLGPRPVHHNVRHGQHFQQQPHAAVLVGCGAEEALSVQDDQAQARLESSPHADGAGGGGG